MNEFDPMKDHTSSNDRQNAHTASGADTYSASESTETGRRYTNPDGSHGFIYNDRAAEAETRSRRYRGALIAVSAVLVTVLMISGCFLGAYMAARSLADPEAGEDPGYSDPNGEVGTSGGLSIADGTTDEGRGDNGPETNSGASPENNDKGHINGTLTGIEIGVNAEDIPASATINKLFPERSDKNGDGKADIAYGPNGEVLTSAGMDAVSVATVVARVADSVVEITTETIVQSGFIGQYITSGAGSGVIISKEGFIVTNHHVIDGANSIIVRMSDGTEFPAILVGTDEQTDVAVLWINAGQYDLTVATLGSSYDLVVGEDILAIGNPLGSLGGTVTEGMVSATAREISISGTNMTLLQVSAPINPGNSGGGLFNLAGELVGVVNAKMSSEDIEGLGFAIPVDTAYEVILELIDHGYVHGRPSLGVALSEVSSWRETYVCVNDKDHDVLRYEDLILAVDGVKVSSIEDVTAAVRQKKVGDTVELIIYRNQQQMTVSVTVVESVPTAIVPAG